MFIRITMDTRVNIRNRYNMLPGKRDSGNIGTISLSSPVVDCLPMGIVPAPGTISRDNESYSRALMN